MQEQSNTTSNLQKEEFSSFTLKDIFFKYIRFLPLFILSIAVALLIAFIYLRYATPVYKSTGTMMIRNETKLNQNDKFEELFNPGGTQNVQSEIEVLKSRLLMERVVRELGLQITYFAVGKIKEPNIYKRAPFVFEVFRVRDSSEGFQSNIRMVNENEFVVNGSEDRFTFGQVFENKFGVFRLTRKPGSILGKEYNVSWQPISTVATSLSSAITVVPKTAGTSILVISTESTNAELAADIVNQLMVEYQKANKEEKKQMAVQTLEFIDNRLAVLEDEIDSVTRILLAFQQQNNLVDIEQQSTLYFEQISETDKQIMAANISENIAGYIEEYLRNSQNEYSRVPSSLSLADPTLNTLILGYNQMQQQRKDYLDGNVPRGNIVVRQLEEQIEKTRKNLLENLHNIRASYRAQIAQLTKRSSSAQGQAKTLPAKVQQMMEIERLVETKREIAKILLEKQAETAISQASTISDSKVLDEAVVAKSPVKPNRRAIQLIALVIGIGIPALVIFVLEILNDKITTRHDIEKITQAVVLGEVGHSYSENALVVNKTNRGMVAEQFRIIRSNLDYVLHDIEKPVLMVTSSFSGEGKSFVSTNLGAVMALAGKKTIVLEFDIRKPKILSGLDLPKTSGITNYLLGKAELDELPIQVPDYENLYVLACGPVPPNPSELLLDKKVDQLFKYLKENFDVILIDTAPVGMVSDAMTLSKYAEATLYIVRQGYTYKKQIALIDDFFTNNKLPKISIVINDVKIKPGYGYYGYGRYGYGYGYGAGYYEETTKPKSFVSRILNRTFSKKKRSSRKADG